jgi:hypothetical protein
MSISTYCFRKLYAEIKYDQFGGDQEAVGRAIGHRTPGIVSACYLHIHYRRGRVLVAAESEPEDDDDE